MSASTTKPVSEICKNRLNNIHNVALCICKWADNRMFEKAEFTYKDVVELQHFYDELKMLSKNHDIDVREL